jgi:uncharacterized SAM-binding protein YcdF (DUF218 family)
MIFSRKYVFETRKTKARRLLLNSAVAIVAVTLLYVTFLATIVVVARNERERWALGLFQRDPDALVVFTGDRGRIQRAIEMLKKWPEAQLLISGVHGANSLKTLVAGQTNAQDLLDSPAQVELDYEALDTMGNVRETLEHLAPKARSLLVVTSDYHVMRVRMIFAADRSPTKPDVFFEGIPTNYTSWKQLKKLMLESVKIVRVWLLLRLVF